MNNADFKKKISNQWGALSKEHSFARKLVEKSNKWDKYQYEKFGPQAKHKNEKKYTATNSEIHSDKTSWMPNDREIFRVTWSYLFARAGWIFMAYTMMFVFLGLMFAGMYVAMR